MSNRSRDTRDPERRLEVARWTVARDREWGSCPPEPAVCALAERWWPGAQVLPFVRFVDASVYPIVTWNIDELAHRTRGGLRPILTPRAVRDTLVDLDASAAEPSVLQTVGFVGLSPVAAALGEVVQLQGIARTVILIPPAARPRRLTLAECDLRGTAIVRADPEGPHAIVHGDPGPRAGSAMSPIWARFFNEQLLDWAIRSQRVPDHDVEKIKEVGR